MKYLILQSLIRSASATFFLGFLLSTTAFLGSTSTLFLAAPFVSDRTESDISLFAKSSIDAMGRYFSYLILLAIFGTKIYYKHLDRMEIEREILFFDRAEIQL